MLREVPEKCWEPGAGSTGLCVCVWEVQVVSVCTGVCLCVCVGGICVTHLCTHRDTHTCSHRHTPVHTETHTPVHTDTHLGPGAHSASGRTIWGPGFWEGPKVRVLPGSPPGPPSCCLPVNTSPLGHTGSPWSFPASLAPHTITPRRPDPCHTARRGSREGPRGLPPGQPHPPSMSPLFSPAFGAPTPDSTVGGEPPCRPPGGARLPSSERHTPS